MKCLTGASLALALLFCGCEASGDNVSEPRGDARSPSVGEPASSGKTPSAGAASPDTSPEAAREALDEAFAAMQAADTGSFLASAQLLSDEIGASGDYRLSTSDTRALLRLDLGDESVELSSLWIGGRGYVRGGSDLDDCWTTFDSARLPSLLEIPCPRCGTARPSSCDRGSGACPGNAPDERGDPCGDRPL